MTMTLKIPCPECGGELEFEVIFDEAGYDLDGPSKCHARESYHPDAPTCLYNLERDSSFQAKLAKMARREIKDAEADRAAERAGL